MSMQYIFLGPPGSGKGTQAAKLVDEKGLKHISTGDLLRAEIKKGTELGRKVDGVLKAGDLVDDQLVLELLKANCDLKGSSYIFDGFPRNIEQVKLLDEEVLEGVKSKAIYFKISTDLLVDRLTQRRLCKGCGAIYNLKTKPPKNEGVCEECGESKLYHRDDDKEDVIRNRMQVFEDGLRPVLDFYDKKGILSQIDASGASDEVNTAILALL